jgi:hypothetical protein
VIKQEGDHVDASTSAGASNSHVRSGMQHSSAVSHPNTVKQALLVFELPTAEQCTASSASAICAWTAAAAAVLQKSQ